MRGIVLHGGGAWVIPELTENPQLCHPELI